MKNKLWQILDNCYPTIVFVAIIIGVGLTLWGGLAGAVWMFVTGIFLLIGGLVGINWIY